MEFDEKKELKDWTPADIIACASGLLDANELSILTLASIGGGLLTLLPNSVDFLVNTGLSRESAVALLKKIASTALRNAALLKKISDATLLNAMNAISLDEQKVSRIGREIASLQVPRTPQKRRPMDAALAIWQRIEEPESPDAKRVTKLIADSLDTNERIPAILKLQQTLMPAVDALRPKPAELNLPPLRDREEQLEEAAKIFTYNCSSYARPSERKNLHSFLTVTAGTGFGKTRFCIELGKVFQSSTLTVRTKAIKKKIIIALDFSNGDGPREDLTPESYNMKSDEQKSSLPNEFLGKRLAAHGLFNCKFKTLKVALEGEYFDLQKTLQFADVMAAIASMHGTTEKEPIGVLLILDEINYLFEYGGLAKDIIALLGNFMNNFPAKAMQNTAGIVLFPVIAGTAIHGVESIFQASDFGNINIPLGVLSLDSSKDIFQNCLPDMASALQDKQMLRLLLLYGNIPSILMLIINIASEMTDLLDDISWRKLITLVESKTNEFHHKYRLCKLGLSHVEVVLSGIEKTADTMEEFKPIEKEGLVYITNRCFMLPYVYLKSANIECEILPAELLPSPGHQYSWSCFEHLEHLLQPLRVRTQLKIKKYNGTQFELSTFLPPGSTSIRILAKMVILKVLTPITCRKKLLIETTDKLSLNAIETQGGTKNPDQFSSYTFLPGAGNALFDILEFYKRPGGKKPIALFKQMKHLTNTETNATIGPQPIKDWVEKMHYATEHLRYTYKCLFMLITNKRVPSRMDVVEECDKLIIIDSTMLLRYYGPTVALFADLIAFDEAATLVDNNETL